VLAVICVPRASGCVDSVARSDRVRAACSSRESWRNRKSRALPVHRQVKLVASVPPPRGAMRT